MVVKDVLLTIQDRAFKIKEINLAFERSRIKIGQIKGYDKVRDTIISEKYVFNFISSV
jgi:hypothetical protein